MNAADKPAPALARSSAMPLGSAHVFYRCITAPQVAVLVVLCAAAALSGARLAQLAGNLAAIIYLVVFHAVLLARLEAYSARTILVHLSGTAALLCIAALFGAETPVSALKGYLGHTMGACGAIELAATLQMMREGVLCPNRNFEEPGEGCGGIGHLTAPLEGDLRVVIKNASAFGGLNASLVCRRMER